MAQKKKYMYEWHAGGLKHFSSLSQGSYSKKSSTNLLNSYKVQLLPAEFCHFFWTIFQPGTQLWIWMLFYERRFGNNAKQNLGIMVIIIQNNTELQPEMA